MTGTIAGLSDEVVTDATGEPWAHWLELLDERDGTAPRTNVGTRYRFRARCP